MAIADKLMTVAENVPKVYHAGQMNVVENAECLKGSKSGSAFLLDDVSPVSHDMEVKVRGKNLIPYPFTYATFEHSGITFTDNKDGTITLNGQNNGSAISNYNLFQSADKLSFLKPNTDYYLSCNLDNIIRSLRTVKSDGTYKYYTYGNVNFSSDETPDRLFIQIKTTDTTTYNNTIVKLQLELGTTATDYTPYVPDLTAVKVSRYGKNLTNSLTDIRGHQNSSVISRDSGIVTVQSGNVITYSSHATLFEKKLPSGTYTFSFDCTIENIKKCTKPNYVQVWVDNKFLSAPIYDMWKDGTYHRSFNFKITKKSSVLIRFYFNVDSITGTSDIPTTVAFSNVQLELGSTATDYEPYNSKTDYTPNADGTVEGVTSLYPNTTLMTDTDGVIIDCNYYKDIDKAFNELTTSVALSGGE